MQRTGVKTFIYSFVLSLSAIFSADRFFAFTPQQAQSQSKILSKNITLFLKQDNNNLALSATPAKKIMLSRLETPKKSVEIQELDTPVIAVENSLNNSNVVFQRSEDNGKIDTSYQIAELNDNIPLDKLASDLKITRQADTALPIQEKEEKKIVYAPQKEHIVLSPVKEEKHPISSAPNKLFPDESQKIATSTLAAAHATVPAEKLFIPLEKKDTPLFAQAEAKKPDEISNTAVALNASNVPMKSLTLQKTDKAPQEVKNGETNNWQQMKDKKKEVISSTSDPWVIATRRGASSNKLLPEKKDTAKIKETFNKKQDTSEQEILLAAETIDNLLIPIPKEILEEENITPQLISSPENAEIKRELEAKGLIVEAPKKEEKAQEASKKEEKVAETTEKKTGILDSISSIFSSNEKLPEIGDEISDDNNTSLFSAFSRKKDKIITKILPTEIRLSFQTNRAEISGQTLKWIKAFAQKTAEDPSVGLEIRIDGTSSPLLQRRRLNLLQNILLNEGAPAEKIKTTFTAREPNSFILRTVKYNAKITNSTRQNKNKYIQW